jgi:hypothetical protein
MGMVKFWLMDIEDCAYDASRSFDNYNEALAWFLSKYPNQKRIFDDIWFDAKEDLVMDEY